MVNQDGARFGWAGQRLLPFALEAAFVDRPAGAKDRLNARSFSSAHRDALAEMKKAPWFDDFLDCLRALRPSLQNIESIAVGDRDEPHVIEVDGTARKVYPLAYAGDGFRRALLIAAALARASGGVVAIDEPEAFAHPRLHSALVKMMRRGTKEGTQVVLATHSLEFVRVAVEVFQDDLDRVAVVGLRLVEGELDPLVIPGADAHRRMVEFDDDLRL